MKTNQDYKNAALAALKGNWAPAVVCSIVFVLMAVVSSVTMELIDAETMSSGGVLTISVSLMCFSFLVLYPVQVGYLNTHRELLSNGDNSLTGNMFRIGFSKWGRNVWGMLLMSIFVFLWTLLFIIPGLVKSFAYALTPFILKDYPELSANEAINLSKKMMNGHKFDLFWLELSFIGWILLGILTLGIGYFWVLPYMYTSIAGFYEDVKAGYEANNSLTNNN